MRSAPYHLSLLAVLITTAFSHAQSDPQWPSMDRETKPWTRWWWQGSAVTKAGITAEMEAYKKAGLGGLEITPIYGVHGTEKQFVDYLSPEWMELLRHTLSEGERLDMGIDMATGTGWPFGGPWVTEADACKDMVFKVYTVKGGGSLTERISFVQEAFVRAVGNQVYEVHDSTIQGEDAKGTVKEPLVARGNEIEINQLVEPIADNPNLQALALDQVKFEKELPLQTLMAYSDAGATLDLTGKVDKEGMLQWKAPAGNWKLYAVFSGWHGKMVERAGPGGEGNVIDHFSAPALQHYLQQFDDAFKDHDITSLRAFFNDSYEVDDARGSADWTPLLFDAFQKRRGYDLRQHLPALFGQDAEDKNNRVLCDYRETISELVLENFTRPWKSWANAKKALVRNQAHGSPSNILDLYATVDIPEIEGIEPLRIKMASSAGNVTGKKLVSSESATWLNEHFESNLADIKTAVDRFMLNGVNHIFYHGTCYSPPGEPWPGWLFYAAVHLNPRNSLWPHFSALNNYVARSQSLLQQASPDNDVLLYYPIYDRFSAPGPERIEHFDGVGAQFDNTVFKKSAEIMLERGYAYDYISDRQIIKSTVADRRLVTEGNSLYETLLIPHCEFIPLATMRKIMALAEEGATILMVGGPPASVSGYANLSEQRNSYASLLGELTVSSGQGDIREIKRGRGRIILGNDTESVLAFAHVRREIMADKGLQFLRKKTEDQSTLYFISAGDASFEGWITIQANGEGAVLWDPMTGKTGTAQTKKLTGATDVFIQLKAHETIFVVLKNKKPESPPFQYTRPGDNPVALEGPWTIQFLDGGPALPPPSQLKELTLWSTMPDSVYRSFSGTATYRLSFKKPRQKVSRWLLDLGDVKESAEVFLNGKSIGTLLGPVFQVCIESALLQKNNLLEIKVCNLMANRIAYLDKHNVFWKKFYNVNFPARKAENRKGNIFDAAGWKSRDSGMAGPVTLTPLLSK